MGKNAFTLAEVLITLSIIGVVAAMTMPTLIGKYNKMVWTNQLKKSYSTVSQGFQKMLADESAPDILSTSFVSERESLGKYLKTLNITNGDRNNAIAYYMENASGKVSNEDLSDELTEKYDKYNLADGSILYTYPSIDKKVYIDVNGNKGPNVVDRDLFYFYLEESGILKPFIAANVRSCAPRCVGSGPREICMKVCSDIPGLDIPGSGAARIMQAGWKMEY